MQILFQQPGTSFPGGVFNYDLDRSVKSFLVKFRWTAGTGPVQDAANSPLKLYLPNVVVTAYVTTKDAGQVKSCTQFPLSALMEFAAFNEGAIFTRANPAVPLEINEIAGFIDICPGGALHMGNDEQLRISFEGLPTIAGFNFTLYAMEAPVLDYAVYTYDQFSVASNVKERSFDLRGIDTLIIPTTSGVIKEFLFRYSNGQAARYQEEELAFICQNTNDLATSGASVNYGFSSHYVIDTAAAVSLDVVTSGAGLTFFAVSDNPATKPSVIAPINAALVSTTDDDRVRKAAAIESK